MLDGITRRLIGLALEEDLGPGDLTSRIISDDRTARANVVAREPLVLAGTDALVEVFRQLDPRVWVEIPRGDGASIETREVIADVSGPARSILSGERLALNLLQRLCAIATRAREATEMVGGTNARIVDTRKTTPGLRALEKAAVRAGGAHNHRFGLFDGVLIKDNHIADLGSITAAVRRAREVVHHLVKIECECDTLAQVDEAVSAGADVVLLDNMDVATLREAVSRVAGRALTEASGGITWTNLRDVAATGVDFISMGALTHTVRAMDVALDWSAE
ncbi:MAG: carboxylating nicotinate-nucleotide diphosphorylase [Myxococcales bacterium]|nr:carboxylating nicotinate-nucleotide diphosphorylase [Myxococcales bacterium]